MSDSKPIYLDFNATTPIDPAVADAMIPYLREHFGNPSSLHAYGMTAKAAVENARGEVAALLGAEADEIVFTSGGSESNNMVIKGVAASLRDRGRHIITSAVEHPAVIEPCAALEREGYRVTRLPVDALGRVDPRDLTAAIRGDTILVTVMHANNEVGTIQPIEELAAIAREQGVLVHTDAAQSVGKVPVDVRALGVDMLSVAGHKLYAPKGIGALYVRRGLDLPKFMDGAGHEAGRRAGTENVLEIVGLGRAASLAMARLPETPGEMRALRDHLLETLRARLGELRINGDLEGGLPNTLSVCFRGVDATTLLTEVGDQVAASAGAACHAEGVDLSTVLEAMEVPLEDAMGTVRFSVGHGTTRDEIERAVEIVAGAVERLGGSAPLAVASGADAGEIKLTRFTHGMGCACKLRPQDLEEVLRALPPVADPSVLVGTDTRDDAAVYKLSDELAVVQTVDFFTPIADDPYDFGAIAASNALSDVWAMGATPRFALSIVGFPVNRLPTSVLARILEGAHDTARAAGVEIVGGHSVEDPEPKYGLAVTGVVHPERVLTNAGARPGDVLVLTKPLGTGIVATAAKRGLAPPEVLAVALETMKSLNREAAEAMQGLDVHACTDVTGFGLLGHLYEMTTGSGVEATLFAEAVPEIEGVRALAAAGMVPGGTRENLAHVDEHVTWSGDFGAVDKAILADAQTSGGLLIALASEEAAGLVAGLENAAVVARIDGPGTGHITVKKRGTG